MLGKWREEIKEKREERREKRAFRQAQCINYKNQSEKKLQTSAKSAVLNLLNTLNNSFQKQIYIKNRMFF